MSKQEWAELIERYIVRGETPKLESVWDTEKPETYVERRYGESGEPSEAREVLIETLEKGLAERNESLLNRGLRLIILAPHPDFAGILQEVFFTLRNDRENGLEDVALLALRAMQGIQAGLGKTDPLRSVWQAMWLALLGGSKVGSGDPKFGITAYQGLRQLDTSVALHYLPLLLRRKDLHDEDCKIILRGLRRDSTRAHIDLAGAIAETIVGLTEEEWLDYQASLLEAFGDDIMTQAIEKARAEVDLSLEQDFDLLNLTSDSAVAKQGQKNIANQSPVRVYLHERLFHDLAAWVGQRLPVQGVSIWLVDEAEQQVHFRGKSGLPPTKYSPRIIKFGEYTSGRVAERHEAELIDLTDEQGPPVYVDKDSFLRAGIKGLLSLYASVGHGKKPSLAIVVNYFDDSVERLSRLKEPCERNAKVIVEACQRIFKKYADAWTADLTSRLTEKPMLTEAANVLVNDTSKAIPTSDRVALYLFNSEVRDLFRYALYEGSDSEDATDTSNYRPVGIGLGDRLTGFTAQRNLPLRIADLREWGEIHGCLSDVQRRLKELGLNEASRDLRINYLGVSLREPAPSGFIGMLGGVIEVYRCVPRDSDQVFTPVGEHIVVELAEAATPFLLGAYNSERRFSQLSVGFPSEFIGSVNGAEQLNAELNGAEQSFSNDLRQLLGEWNFAQQSTRSFLAFRTLRNKCKSVWSTRQILDEKEARLELQHAILTHDLFLLDERAYAIDPDILERLEIGKQFKKPLLELGLVLIPLIDRGQLEGILGLEFGSETEALRVTKQIRAVKNVVETEFVRTSIMRSWVGHRRHLRALFGASFEHLSLEATKAGNSHDAQKLFNFVAGGSADVSPNERTYGELAATALRRVPSDAKCNLNQECDSWMTFARASGGQLEVDVEPVELMAVPSAIRMVLTASTASVLCGGKADISLGQKANAGWRYVQIAAHENGHENIRKEGLALTKGISEYRGWDCEYNEGEETLCISLPSIRP